MNQRTSRRPRFAQSAALVTMLVVSGCSLPAVDMAHFPSPAVDQEKSAPGKRTAIFSGGCFWCTEAVFDDLAGVSDVVSGYTGGAAADAEYHKVSTGTTGHSESIRLTYDPAKVSYGTLLKVLFAIAIDATQKGGQGPDWGPQYESVIWFTTPEQERIARAYIKQLNAAKVFGAPIATEIRPAKPFYTAEAYHQQCARKNPNMPYIAGIAIPKTVKLRKYFPELLKK